MSAHPMQSKPQSLKILFITENFPFPLDSGGRIRTFHILKGLARHHEVTLITTLSNEEQMQNIVVFQNICKNVSIVRVKKKTSLEKVKRVFKNLFSPIPIVVEMHYSPEVVSEIKLQMDREVFNVVHFDHLDASYYLPIIEQRAIFGQKIMTVLDEHNIVSNQVKTSIDAEPNFIKKFYMRTQLEKTFQYEKKVCSLVTRNLVCSEYDKKSLLAMTKESASVVTIPNGVDVGFFSDKSGFDNRKFAQVENSIVFVGMLDYGPGAVAIRFFCKEVLPILIQEIPEIKFYVIGSNPPPYLQSLTKGSSNIFLKGRVKDIRPYVHRAKAFVVPLKSGSGTRLKILDAMAMGIPVISTSIGAEGLEVKNGQNIMIADSAKEFSDAIVEVLSDESLASRIKQNAFDLVQKKYSWDVVWDSLSSQYPQLN